ncbi:MAG: hypothetical protein IT539_13820 [Bradyrhizobiaceae bacterium]|nr:hypothetical protein [Bradyrhizobiaceae bacterium]
MIEATDRPDLPDLPFISQKAGDLNYWDVSPSDDYETDVGLGALYARLALEAVKQSEDGVLLAMVLRDMVMGGTVGAMEMGFIAALAQTARAGSMN